MWPRSNVIGSEKSPSYSAFAECHGNTLLGRRGTVLDSQTFGDAGTNARQAFLDIVPAQRQLAACSGARRRRQERRVQLVFGAQTKTTPTRRYVRPPDLKRARKRRRPWGTSNTPLYAVA